MVEILDASGQPIRRASLDEPQTSRFMQLHREFAQHPSRGLTPSKLARILDDAEQGDVVSQYELFDDMEEKDAHVACEMGKRRRAMLSLEWDVVPPPNPSAAEKRAAAELRELLTEIPDFEDVVFDATDAIGKGFGCQEIEWHRLESRWLPKSVTHRPQSWFRLVRGFRQEIRLRDYSTEGETLTPFGWITHIHRAKSGYVERAALFRVLLWPYLFKNYSLGDLAEFLEIYGIPLRLGKYHSGASEHDKTTLLRALVQIGHNAAGIIPKDMEISFEAAAQGDPKAFELMIDWCERSQSKSILGVTLTTQADRGSNTNALGKVHNELRKDLRDGDARQVQSTLTRDLVYPIAALNGLAESLRRCPRMAFNLRDTEDLKDYADALPKLVGMGLRVGRKWTQEQLGIPEPEGEEDVLSSAQEARPAAPADDSTRRAAAKLGAPRVAEPSDAIAALLERQAEGLMDALVSQVRELVEHAGSLEEIRDGLLRLAPNLPPAQLAELMGQALVAADLVGRSEVDDAVDDERDDGATR